MVARSHFDAIIIGHSLPAKTRAGIIRAVRQIAPQTPVIFVYIEPSDAQEPLADYSVEVTDPLNLIRALEDLPE